MAGSVNKVILVGRLGKDPELKYTPSGAPVAKFSLATDESFKDKTGEKQNHTEWHNIVAWNKLAEICGEYLTKGKLVYIEGSIRSRQWQDQSGQQTHFLRNHRQPDADAGIEERRGTLGGRRHERPAAERPAPRSSRAGSPPPPSAESISPPEPEISDEDIPF